MEILKLLDKSKIILSYNIIEYKIFNIGFYIKIQVEIINQTNLFITEYFDENERNYSYHWQNINNELIVRWDNALFHKEIETFPHHQHTKNGIFESYTITIQDVLNHIEKQLNKL